MRSFIALLTTIALLPGCCVIGMTAGRARAQAHNDEVAAKLERGEYVGPEDQAEQSVDRAGATGFVVGALIDAAVVALAVSRAQHNWEFGPSKVNEY